MNAVCDIVQTVKLLPWEYLFQWLKLTDSWDNTFAMAKYEVHSRDYNEKKNPILVNN